MGWADLHIFPLTTATTSAAAASAGGGGESRNRKLVPSNAAIFCSHRQTVVKKIVDFWGKYKTFQRIW